MTTAITMGSARGNQRFIHLCLTYPAIFSKLRYLYRFLRNGGISGCRNKRFYSRKKRLVNGTFFDNHYKEQPFFFAVAGICHLRVRGGAKKSQLKPSMRTLGCPGKAFIIESHEKATLRVIGGRKTAGPAGIRAG